MAYYKHKTQNFLKLKEIYKCDLVEAEVEGILETSLYFYVCKAIPWQALNVVSFIPQSYLLLHFVQTTT